MSVRAGREFLAIPGPTTVPDEVLRAMHRPAVDIYSGPLLQITDSLLKDVSKVFNTKGRGYLYISNGHGAWEASLTNVLSKGDKILVLESGRFAIGWGENARRMGVEVEILKGDMRRAVRPAELEARLKADKGNTIKAVLVAQVDTASGVVNDIKAIGEAIRAAKHEALLAYILEHPKEKSIVFCQFIGEMNKIHDMLAQQNMEIFRIDGSVDKDDREARVKAFKASTKASVFLIQIKSGGVGLNLQAATRVYITSPSWNPATELQAIGRAHRTGQTQKVYIKRLIYAGDEQLPSVEQSILELQDQKNRICAEVLNDQRILNQLPKKKSNVTFYDLKRIFKV